MGYQVKYKAQSRWYKINHLSIHVRHWARPNKPKLLMLHGWMDVSASFQFVVDNLAYDWDIYAMDWRGMGQSEHIDIGYYDRSLMISDLCQLVDLISPQEPIHILGHSLGGMLLSLYAGIFPNRVRSVILAEGFGIPDDTEQKSFRRLINFTKNIKQPVEYTALVGTRENYIQKLIKNNPLLTYEKALYLSYYLLTERAGQLMLSADIKHRISQPFPYNFSLYVGFWRKITAPILWIQGDFVSHNLVMNSLQDILEERYQLLGSPKRVLLKNVGHMVHWEASEDMARAIQIFLNEV